MAFIAVYDADVAQIIVTKNLRDFPAVRLAPWDITAPRHDGPEFLVEVGYVLRQECSLAPSFWPPGLLDREASEDH